jgi:hypothetical protein
MKAFRTFLQFEKRLRIDKPDMTAWFMGKCDRRKVKEPE